jgi:hypothetical protein
MWRHINKIVRYFVIVLQLHEKHFPIKFFKFLHETGVVDGEIEIGVDASLPQSL